MNTNLPDKLKSWDYYVSLPHSKRPWVVNGKTDKKLYHKWYTRLRAEKDPSWKLERQIDAWMRTNPKRKREHYVPQYTRFQKDDLKKLLSLHEKGKTVPEIVKLFDNKWTEPTIRAQLKKAGKKFNPAPIANLNDHRDTIIRMTKLGYTNQ